jgi:Ca2+-transporting ATPase
MSRQTVLDRPWTHDGSAVAAELGVDPRVGLSWEEARQRWAVHGPNELDEGRRVSAWRLLLTQFTNVMIVVLLGAGVITALLGDLKDTVVILAIVVLNGVIGFVQEYRAEQALVALRRLTSPEARVVRGGATVLVSAREVVPGDVVLLDTGDIVAADLRLLDAPALRIDEATLTGESEPADKTVDPLPDVGAGARADQHNVAFGGTAVVHGRGRGVVVATGMATALGRVAQLLQEADTGAPTPLQRRLASVGRAMAVLAVVVCASVFVVGVIGGEPPQTMFVVAVSLAVAAIPEGLPAVVTVALALGARRMARHRALLRRLPAVETLGSVSVICSDKTGTLTENRMVVERVWTPAGAFRVTGEGYAPEGRISPDGGAGPSDGVPTAGDGDALARLGRIAAACNDAELCPPEHPDAAWTVAGDPTEGALLALARKCGLSDTTLGVDTPRVAEVAFDAGRRRMTTLHADGDGVWVACKGALEALAPLLVPEDEPLLGPAAEAAERYAAAGYRVLALADRTLADLPETPGEAETGLRLAGLVAMADPPRPAGAASIASCRAAGMTPVMITGDHPVTARAIAGRLGILGADERTLTGDELDTLSDSEFLGLVESVRVYARMNPEQKLRIVRAWQGRGAVVAMTGDGVNDAPALRLADIGVAMGLMGTEVSKQAADMVLGDDDFATIVRAVEEGRRIYDNIRRFLRYLLTTNSAEVWVMFMAPLLGLPVPLLAVQILWINLVSDGLPALALGVEPVDRDAMRRPPRPPGESILARGLWVHALGVGIVMAAVVLGLEAYAVEADWPWQTMVFTTMALIQLGHALAVRSERTSLFTAGLRSNTPLTVAVLVSLVVQLALVYVPILQPVFVTETLSAVQLTVVLLVSTTAFVVVELEKALFRRFSTRPA